MRIDSGMGAEVGAGPPQNCSDDLTLERFLHIFDSVVDLQNAVSARPPGLWEGEGEDGLQARFHLRAETTDDQVYVGS